MNKLKKLCKKYKNKIFLYLKCIYQVLYIDTKNRYESETFRLK